MCCSSTDVNTDFTQGLEDAEEGKKWLTLKYPDLLPAMQKCKREETRKGLDKLRAAQCEEANTPLLEDTLRLRAEIAGSACVCTRARVSASASASACGSAYACVRACMRVCTRVCVRVYVVVSRVQEDDAAPFRHFTRAATLLALVALLDRSTLPVLLWL